MCPDKETLSAFIDNEIEGKFKQIVQDHINTCEKCRQEVESFNSLHPLFYEELSLEQIKNAEERVWDKIRPVSVFKPKPDIWHRRIAIPVPVMAAAVLIFISAVLSFYFTSFNKFNNNNHEPNLSFSESITFDKEEDFGLFETDQVLDVSLTLPESTVFVINGAPKLIREVDYLNKNR